MNDQSMVRTPFIFRRFIKMVFILTLLLWQVQELRSQMSFENLNYSLGGNCDPLTYNRFTGSYHSNLYIGNQVGSNVLLAWGQNMLTYTTATTGNITAPSFVSAASYAGVPYEVRSSSTGGASGPSVMGLRTSTKLYIFGNTANINAITTMPGFGSGSLVNANADVSAKLPAGVAVSDIAQFAISPTAIAIVTNAGDVYMLTRQVNLQGDKAGPGPAVWHHVVVADGSFLKGVVKFSLSNSGAFALTSTGKIYYWGAPANVNGVVNTATSYNYAYDMSAQIPAGTSVVDLVVLGQTTGTNDLFLLCNNLKVYSTGINTDGVLGVGNPSTIFNQGTFQPVVGLNNIVRIDGNTEAGLFTMGAMDSSGRIFGWGDGVSSMLGIASQSSFTTTYTNTSPVDIYGVGGFSDFSISGHFTIAFFTDLSIPVDQYWYVGHNTGGSIGLPAISTPVINNSIIARLDAPATISFNCSNTQPTIDTIGSFSPFVVCAGMASVAQTIQVSGNNLTNNLNIIAPAGFEISLSSGSGFVNNLTLVETAGSIPLTTIYVRISASSSGTISGNLSLTSSGAATKLIPISGTINPLPVITSVIGATRSGPGSVTLSGTVSPAAGTTIDWYADSLGGTALAVGTLNYTTGNLMANTKFYAEARNTITGCLSNGRTPVLAIINGTFNAGTIGSNQTICVGLVAEPLISVIDASGGTGAISYQWQSSLDNLLFTNIPGATGLVYSPPLPSQTIYYRRLAITVADGAIPSNTITILVNPKPVVNFSF